MILPTVHQFAPRPRPHARRGACLQLVRFRLDQTVLGMALQAVRQISKPLPFVASNDDSQVTGVVDLRGQRVALLDLHRFFGLTTPDFSDDARLIVVDWNGHLFGFIADSVDDVVRLPATAVNVADDANMSVHRELLAGAVQTADGATPLIDVDRVFGNVPPDALANVPLSA